MTKLCHKCEKVKDSEEFGFHITGGRIGRMKSRCRSCRLRLQAETRARPGYREKMRDHKFIRRYGITALEFDLMLSEQSGLCGICKVLMSPPCVDHDHTTGKARGLLCRTCNSALHLVENHREAAVVYLKEASWVL